MKRMAFQAPTEHYDERIKVIDEQICHLIKQRKDLSNNNPGFPTKQLISSWAKKYHFYEDFLNGVFSDFFHEEIFRPVVEPRRFIKNIPILKGTEKDEVFFSVTLIRQFENASVIYFNIDRNDLDDEMNERFREHTFFDLSVEGDETEYDCRNTGGGGSMGHETLMFTVSPALPDDITKLKLIFKEYKAPFQEPTGFEFTL